MVLNGTYGVNAVVAAQGPFPFGETVTIGDEGVVSASERMRLTIPWAQVDGVREDDDNLYVDTRGQLSLGVARSAFADAGAEQAFRDAIEAGRQGRWTDDQPTE